MRSERGSHRLIRIAVAGVAAVMFGWAHGASLIVWESVGYPGARIPVTIELETEPGEEVAGIQFDLLFDSSMLDLFNVRAGQAAVDADKDVDHSLVQPGRVRVVISGINQEPIPNGNVAVIGFDVSSAAPLGATGVGLEGVLMSDPDAQSVSASGVGNVVHVEERPDLSATGFMTGLALIIGFLGLGVAGLRAGKER